MFSKKPSQGIYTTHPDIVVSVNLLIGRMSAVISPSNRQQQDIEVENVGKVERDRDGTAFTGVVRYLAVNSLGGLVGGSIRVMLFFFHQFISSCIVFKRPVVFPKGTHVGVSLKTNERTNKQTSVVTFHHNNIEGDATHDPRLTTVGKVNLHLVLGTELLEFFLDILDDKVGDTGNSEVGYKTDREFA